MKQDDPGDIAGGVIRVKLSPGSLGVRDMKEWIKLLIKLIDSLTNLINSIKK